jgi:hypothetical protein
MNSFFKEKRGNLGGLCGGGWRARLGGKWAELRLLDRARVEKVCGEL